MPPRPSLLADVSADPATPKPVSAALLQLEPRSLTNEMDDMLSC